MSLFKNDPDWRIAKLNNDIGGRANRPQGIPFLAIFEFCVISAEAPGTRKTLRHDLYGQIRRGQQLSDFTGPLQFFGTGGAIVNFDLIHDSIKGIPTRQNSGVIADNMRGLLLFLIHDDQNIRPVSKSHSPGYMQRSRLFSVQKYL